MHTGSSAHAPSGLQAGANKPKANTTSNRPASMSLAENFKANPPPARLQASSGANKSLASSAPCQNKNLGQSYPAGGKDGRDEANEAVDREKPNQKHD